MNRLVEYEVRNNGLGLKEMIDRLVEATWKAPRRKNMEGLIQLQTEQVLLTYLLAASVDEDNSFITRAVVQQSLAELKRFIESKQKVSTDVRYTGHLLLALERMKTPGEAKPTKHIAIPPGSPIGCEEY